MKVRTEAKRDAILAVAAEVFLELGYKRSSMTEIAARVGGSKATLYGYFASKEELFTEVTRAMAAQHIEAALTELNSSPTDRLAQVLQRFGEQLNRFMCSAEAVATHRMVIAEAAHSDIGQLFYDAGPKPGLATIAAFFQAAMDRGQLRQADAAVAALHFDALINAETQHGWFLRDAKPPTPEQGQQMVARAIETFLGGYGV